MSADARPTWLLSIHEDTNANATLFRDGEPVFAVAEERLTRRKFAAGFPVQSVQACLDFAGLRLDDIDEVLPANRTHFLPRVLPGLLPDEEHDYLGAKHKAWLYFQDALAHGPWLQRLTEGVGRLALRRRFPRLAECVDHHTAHAASAWLTSGFEPCLAVTADNMGDGFSSKVFVCRGRDMALQYGSSARHSPGQFYGEIAQFLGFHNLMAGKVTGLAAYGDPRPAYALMAGLFGLDESRTAFVSPGLLWRHRKRHPYDALRAFKPADVAAAAQKRLEDVLVDYVREAVRRTGLRDVVLAGGTFANVVLNQRILQLPEIERVYVHPAMTDQGISLGAGLHHLHRQGRVRNRPLDTPFLGPGVAEEAAGRALETAQLRAERPADLAGEVAALLAAGKVVARFDGRLEYGPRALGNRSILYRSDDPAANQWLNERLRRSEFMPFAPVTLASHAAACYRDLRGGELASKYMTMTFGVTDAMRAQSPGVVHLDGTARPQVLEEADNPGYFAILRRFYELTGVPTLVNTSFNLHSEPIVCTAQDAILAFRESQLDALVLGPFLVRGAKAGAGGLPRPQAIGRTE